jgi:hypothetical protein
MYTVSYDPEAWVRVSNGAPEWRQVVEMPIDGGMRLIVMLARSARSGPRVAEARIEQRYLTRREGWKRRTVQRLAPSDVKLENLS